MTPTNQPNPPPVDLEELTRAAAEAADNQDHARDWLAGYLSSWQPSVALALIAELTELRAKGQGGWVACSERMPDDNATVYFFAGGEVCEGTFNHEESGDYWNDDETIEYWTTKQVSHWMPRFVSKPPAPPEAL